MRNLGGLTMLNPFKYSFRTLWWYWLPGLLMLCLIAFFHFRVYNALNPDLVAYFSVARHYQQLNFTEAFNSYWSPLICWLLALMPNLQTDPMSAFRWVNIAVAIACYHQLYFWIRLVLRNSVTRFFFALLAAMFLCYQAMYIGSPDFLSVFSFLLFLKILIRFKGTFRHALYLALTILLCFFSKTFLFMLCVSVLGIFFCVKWYRARNITGLAPLMMAGLMTAAGLFLWSSCLKLHYGFYTLSSAFTYNTSAPSQDRIHLDPPPRNGSLFIWEDPYYITVQSEYSGTFGENVQKLLCRWEYNGGITLYYFRYFSWFRIWILLIPLLGILTNSNRRNQIALLMFAVFFFNWFGYFSLVLHERYLVVGQLVLYLSVFGFVERLTELSIFRFFTQQIVKIAAVVFLFLATAKSAVIELKREWKNFPFAHQQIEHAKKLAASGILKGKSIATYNDSELLYDCLSLACFLGGGQYFGEMDAANPEAQQKAEVANTKLDLMVTVDCGGKDFCENRQWLQQCNVLMQTDTVYSVRPFYEVRVYKVSQSFGKSSAN